MVCLNYHSGSVSLSILTHQSALGFAVQEKYLVFYLAYSVVYMNSSNSPINWKLQGAYCTVKKPFPIQAFAVKDF